MKGKWEEGTEFRFYVTAEMSLCATYLHQYVIEEQILTGEKKAEVPAASFMCFLSLNC